MDCYFENTLKLENKEKGHIFLSKGLCKINLSPYFTKDMNKRIFSYSKLQNFLNPFFNAMISSDDEPILFLGKTSCKTYLCQTIFNDDKNMEIIHLNQETNINQLLGGPTLLYKKEAEFFYFKYLCYLCQRGKDINKLYEQYQNNKLNNNSFKKQPTKKI